MKRTFIIFLISILSSSGILACSMYKITVGNKTMVGCNEDAWRTNSVIWFEKAKTNDEYGVCFTGSRIVGENKFAPQSGMNEAGLVYSRLASYHPKKDIDQSSKKKIVNPITYLTDIMHACKNVDEVIAYIEQYDHSYFMNDVFIYIEKSGKYVVVEPYNLIVGNDSAYVLSNFCPSITDNAKARNLDRFRNGYEYVKLHGIDTSISYCKALSDTMKVCRSRKGDGTLLTSNWDSKNGLVNLYFYHEYDSTIQFNLSKELAKGDHQLSVIDLFPVNNEFERLKSYKNPFNIASWRISLLFFAAFFLLSSILFLVSYFRRKTDPFNKLKPLITLLGFMLTGYMWILASNRGIYYFDAPYVHYSSKLISASSYIPFLLALSVIPIYLLNWKLVKEKHWSNITKWTLSINSIFYTLFLIMFTYWGLFNILN